jgi:hypothetical protein
VSCHHRSVCGSLSRFSSGHPHGRKSFGTSSVVGLYTTFHVDQLEQQENHHVVWGGAGNENHQNDHLLVVVTTTTNIKSLIAIFISFLQAIDFWLQTLRSNTYQTTHPATMKFFRCKTSLLVALLMMLSLLFVADAMTVRRDGGGGGTFPPERQWLLQLLDIPLVL